MCPDIEIDAVVTLKVHVICPSAGEFIQISMHPKNSMPTANTLITSERKKCGCVPLLSSVLLIHHTPIINAYINS